MIRNLLSALLAVGVIAAAAHTASAQGPWGGYGSGYGFGGWPYWTTSVPTPPYFALHPPVYYSVPVPRTYGYSPFAYPGCVMTPDVAMPRPETIINPHVQPLPMPKDGDPKKKKTSGRVAAQVIVNPYFVRPGLAKGE